MNFHPVKQKFRAVKAHADGFTFDSKKEERRYQELKLLLRQGLISRLIVHPKYDLHAKGGERIAQYEADFAYLDHDGREIVEDVKSPITAQIAMYRLKRKWMFAEYGIEIQEIGGKKGRAR